jgi:hypothetical protein
VGCAWFPEHARLYASGHTSFVAFHTRGVFVAEKGELRITEFHFLWRDVTDAHAREEDDTTLSGANDHLHRGLTSAPVSRVKRLDVLTAPKQTDTDAYVAEARRRSDLKKGMSESTGRVSS